MALALTEHDRRAYASNIWKSYLFHFLMHFQLWWAIWVLYLTDLRGFSLTQITVLDALFWMTAVLAEIPTGAVADRFGRKASLILGAASTVAAVVVFGLATSYVVILLSYFAWALGVAFLSGAEHALLFDSLRAIGREDEFQRVAGRQAAIFSFAVLAGGLAGAPIAAATDLSLPVLLSAAIAAPAVLVAFSLREPPLPDNEARLAYGELLRKSATTAFRLPAVRTMLVLSSLVSVLTFGPMLFMQPFLAGHGVDIGLLGFVQMPVRVMAIFGALIAFRMTGLVGTRGMFIAVPLVMGAAYLTLGAWDAVFAFAGFPLVALMNQMLLPTASDYLNRRITSNQRATVLSIRTMLVSLWAALMEPALGAVADAASLQAVYWVSAGLVGVTLPAALILWLRADRNEGTSKVAAPVPRVPAEDR